MYCGFFGLRCPPFDDIPDPRFFYASADHEEALALLRFAAANRKGPVLLTGPLGTGKTLLCRTLLSHLDIGAIPVLGTCSPGDPSGLIRRVCKALNLRLTRSAVPAEDAERLKKHILSRTSPRRSMVLLVLDQVENLTPADFEELSILSSLEVHSSRLLQIILVGHPRVAETLAGQQFEQLRQRMFAVHHLRPLRAEEVPLYVRHRLSEAGCSEEPLFDDDGLSLIAERSEGVPRLVNQLCDAAMLAAFSAGRRTIDRALVSEIILPSAAVSATAKAKAASAEAGADPAAPEQAGQTTTRIEQVLSEGEALAGRLEKALLRAEPITTGANLDPASGGCELAGRSTADRLFELLRDAPDALATAQCSTEAIEQRIEGACARAEGAACRLESAVAESTRLSENITRQIGMIEEACDRARSVRAELSGPADGQGGTGAHTEQRLISLLEKLDATGGMDSLIERLDQAGKLAAEKAEEAIRDLTDRTPQAAREQIETLQATITESRRASEQLHGKIADGQTALEAIEHRLRAGVADGQSVAEALNEASNKAATSVKALQTETDAVQGRSGQLMSVIQAAKATGAGATLVVEEACRAVDHLAGTVSEAEKAVQAIEDRLQANLADGRSTIDTLNETATRAGETIESLREEIGAAQDKSEQVASVTEASREATGQAESVIADAQTATDQLRGQVADGDQAVRAIEQRLEAGIASGENAIAGFEDRLEPRLADGQATADSVNQAIARAGETIESLREEIGAAQDKSEQVASVTEASREATGQAESVIADAQTATDQLRGQVADGDQAVRAIEQRLEAGIASGENAIARFEDRLEPRLADGQATADSVNQAIARAGETIESLWEEIGAAQDKSEQVASVTEASREATGQAESVIADAHGAADQLLGKIVEGGQAVQAIEERLHANLADGRSTIDTLSETAARAGETIDSLREEVSAAQEKSRQIASVTEASQEAARQAQSATSEAQRAAEQLRGQVADGDQAIQAIQERLRASLGDGHSTIEALNEAATWGVHTLDALRVEIGVAREKSEQMASLIEASGEATGQAQSVIADAHRAADQLLGKVADGDQAVEAIEQRLRAGITEGEDAGARLEGRLELRLAAGQAAAESLGETTARGNEAAKTLLVQIGVAEEKARQLGSVTSAAREASQQAASIVQEAHLAAGQLCDTRDGAEAAQQHLESACARAEQDAENLEALQAGATGTVARLDERLSSADSAAERIGRMIDEVWSLTSTTEDRARQLSAEAERVERLLGELRQSGGETKKLAERLATQTPQAAELLSKLGQRCRQVPGLVAQLAEYKKASVQATERCKGQTEQADQAAAALVESVRSSTSLIDKLGQAAARATRTAEKLAERREAAHAALERQQMLHDRDQSLLEQLQVQTCQVEDLLQGLSACTADATRANDQLAENCQRAGQTIEQLAGQIEAVDAREQVLDAAQQTLSEFIGQAESINRQIRKLQGQADSFEVHVSRLLEKPEQIVSDAKAQSAQLQGVCRAVRKVFASLAQATLQANHRIEHFSRMSRTAEGRAHRLSAETARAAETLRNWVNEAVRAHSRLTESLERCPTISQTHPAESLGALASVTRMRGLPGLDNMPEKTPADLPATAEGLGREGAAQARSRTEEISQLIEEARRFAEGEAEMANSEY